jgi:hypothetical protein
MVHPAGLGRKTAMPNAKRSIQAEVTIDGIPLVWRLHREQQGGGADEAIGMAIHVKVAQGVKRELHLEYPVVDAQKPGRMWTAPPRPNITPARVLAHIREAIAAGWDPESRGKPYVYRVDELPG